MTNDNIHRISTQSLKQGMKIIELDRPWIESPFTVQGFKITTDTEIKQLQQSCEYVYVSFKTKIVTDGANLKRQEYSNTLAFEQALPQAKSTHRQAKSVVKGLFKNLRLGQSFETSVAKKAVKQCVDSIIANPDTMLWLSLLKEVDEYTARHSLNVGLLSIVLGRAEGLSPADLEAVGLCGMLHDMGKAEIPRDILNKEGVFSDEEFALMKTHTSRGHKILTAKPDLIAEVANVAHSHHERLNGRGYPRALTADNISYFSRIVAIADAYDAITSKRTYSPAKSSLEGLKILMGAKGSHFDAALVERFVECIGPYPAGSIAELSNKEVAIVLPSERDQRDSPKVLVVRDERKQPCSEKLLDLSQDITDKEGKPITIHHLLSDDSFGIDLKRYHERGGAAVG